MTSGEYKRMNELIENGDVDAQKEINMRLLNELKEIGEILDRQSAINSLNRVSNKVSRRYIDSVATNIALRVKADLLANGLVVTHIDPDQYKKEADI